MCCRTYVWPLDPAIAVAVLTIGQFKARELTYGKTWVREIPEEGTNVTASMAGDHLELVIGPAVSAYIHHAMKRRAAGVYFEIAAKYAEKVGGRIEQRATVDGCTDGQVSKSLLLAEYPHNPMRFDRVCRGFREAILGELEKGGDLA